MSEAAIETMRVKLKVWEHEFEAEGPTEAVQSQSTTWNELMSEATRHISTHSAQSTTQK